MTSYKITIEKIDHDVPFEDKEYKEVGVKENGQPEYDYVYFASTKDVATEIYAQTIANDDFDVKQVIDAFNQV